ncbi:RNA polymerase sigma factor for flagellaroperon [Enterococcus sp. HSIEG1]|nr:RNA polymerase sigma factor for flagellaroperon [Enterococcus sp. HSIEG1]
MYEVDREAEIIKYLPLVERVVQRLSIKTADYESGDLYNIGVIGLMDALRKFDPSKKFLLKAMQ